MPSAVFHLAIAGLIGASLLGDTFDKRTILAVMGITLIPDIDTFLGLILIGAHRAYLHNIFFPSVLFIGLLYDTHIRDESFVVSRWGNEGTRVAWVGFICLAVAGIGMDLFYNGVNLFYPVHDAFYSLSGDIVFSTKEGFAYNVFELKRGTTETLHYWTGIDPTAGPEPEGVERVFVFSSNGTQTLLSFVGFGVVGYRLWEKNRKSGS